MGKKNCQGFVRSRWSDYTLSRRKMIDSSIFFSQMILLHTDEYYLIGAGRKSQPTAHNYYHDHDSSLNQPLLNIHISVKCKQTTRMALKAINLKRH